jgi:hypothetical protein
VQETKRPFEIAEKRKTAIENRRSLRVRERRRDKTAVWKAPLLGARARVDGARGASSFNQRVAAISENAGFFVASPLPIEAVGVNWRMNSSSGFELAAFSWMMMPAFSLRMRLSNVSRTLPLPFGSADSVAAPFGDN